MDEQAVFSVRRRASQMVPATGMARPFRVSTKRLWLTALFPALFVSDILYGGMDYYGIQIPVTPGVILRGLVLLLSGVMLLKNYRLLKRNKVVLFWGLTTATLALPSIVTGTLIGGDLVRDIQYLMRVLYGPFTVLLLVLLIRKYRIDPNDIFRFIEYSAYVLGLSLLASQQLGIQRASYGDYAFGDTGIFYAQNDLTLAFGLALLAATYRLVYSFSWRRLTLIGLSMYACLQIGSRASLAVVLGCALLAVALILWGRPKHIQKMKVRRRVTQWITVVGFAAGMGGMFVYGVSLQSQTSYQQEKLEQIAEGDLPRLLLMATAARHLEKRNQLFNFTGEGMTSFIRGVARYFPGPVNEKAAEVDWMDLYGAYGLLFTIFLHLFFIAVLFGSSRRFLWGNRYPIYGLVAAAFGMYIGHAVLAGHALTSPITTTLIAGYAGVYLVVIRQTRSNGMLGRRDLFITWFNGTRI